MIGNCKKAVSRWTNHQFAVVPFPATAPSIRRLGKAPELDVLFLFQAPQIISMGIWLMDQWICENSRPQIHLSLSRLLFHLKNDDEWESWSRPCVNRSRTRPILFICFFLGGEEHYFVGFLHKQRRETTTTTPNRPICVQERPSSPVAADRTTFSSRIQIGRQFGIGMNLLLSRKRRRLIPFQMI